MRKFYRCMKVGHLIADCNNPPPGTEIRKPKGNRALVEAMATKVLQVNLNYCWIAQQLLTQTMLKRKTDVALISDFYQKIVEDRLRARTGSVSLPYTETGYALARISTTLFYSCYCTPNCTIQEFNQFLCGLEISIRTNDIIVGGDFNSFFVEWGSVSDDARGAKLSGFAAFLDLQICNEGTTPTYYRVNVRSVIDVTLARCVHGDRHAVTNWVVLAELNSASYHEYIEFSTYADNVTSPPGSREVQNGWSVKRLSVESLLKHWQGTGSTNTPDRPHGRRPFSPPATPPGQGV